jgi:hypothetical protein
VPTRPRGGVREVAGARLVPVRAGVARPEAGRS